jgi:2-amino-4-hydroxy-6-hydroxymethyldihydropteridine diphosphokinase
MKNLLNVPFYLSLGSNMGDRLTFLKKALQALHSHAQIQIHEISSIYETEPIGYVQQSPFLNIVAKGDCSLVPEDLLSVTQHVENELGRTREIHWGPRTIDIDILLYNNKELNTEDLVIPHPRMKERAFVLTPLADLAPECIIPGESMNVAQFLAILEGEGVQKWNIKFKDGENGFELFEN